MSGCSQKNYHKLQLKHRQKANTLEAVDRLPEGGWHVGSDKVGSHPCLVKSLFHNLTVFVKSLCAQPEAIQRLSLASVDDAQREAIQRLKDIQRLHRVWLDFVASSAKGKTKIIVREKTGLQNAFSLAVSCVRAGELGVLPSFPGKPIASSE
jgi:hypothetical protein